jgi:hypothetical protein
MLRFFQSLTKKKKQKTPQELQQEVDEFQQQIYKNYIKHPRKYKDKLNAIQRNFTNNVSTIEKQADAVSSVMAFEKSLNLLAQIHGYKNARNYLIKEEEKRIAEEKAKARKEEERRKQREEETRIEEETREQRYRNYQARKNKMLNSLTQKYGYSSKNALTQNAIAQRSNWRMKNPGAPYLSIEDFIESRFFTSKGTRKKQSPPSPNSLASTITLNDVELFNLNTSDNNNISLRYLNRRGGTRKRRGARRQ